MSRDRACWRAGVLLALSLSGCQSPPELTWQGEHVRLGAEQPEAICGGTREYLDQRAGELKARFGTSHTIDYYWVPSGADEYCPGKHEVTGCAPGHEVFSEWIPHEHELVHAAGTDMPAALEEGLATHWGDPWPFYAMASRERLHALLLQQVDITGVEEYARVAHFMAYLSESHGWESLAELDRQLDADSGVDQVDRAFMDIFGKSLDTALTEYEAFPDCTGIVDVSLSCAKDSITIGFLNPEFVREIDCASSEAIGPYDGMAFVEEAIDLESSIDGNRIVRALGDGVEKGGHVLVRRCGPCAENGVGVANSSSIAFVDEAELPAGRYIVRLYVPVEETPATLGLRISG